VLGTNNENETPQNSIQEDYPLNTDARQIPNKLSETEQAINPDISASILIPTTGPQKYIRKCVESVKKHTPEAHEIIFVDNGAGKGTTKWLKQYIRENSNCNLIKCHKNASSAEIYNKGIKASTEEYIVLLSNDAVVSEKWLSGMLECIKMVPDAGIVGPMTNVSRGVQQVSTAVTVSINQLDKIAKLFMVLPGIWLKKSGFLMSNSARTVMRMKIFV